MYVVEITLRVPLYKIRPHFNQRLMGVSQLNLLRKYNNIQF